jgi:hypothetical protein
MSTYVVQWQIDIEAESPEDAVMEAYNLLPFPGSDSIATVFSVTTADQADDPNVTWQTVDVRELGR